MIKKLCCLFIIIAFMSMTGCDDGDPPFKRVLNVPYHSQVYHTYCAAACIQMWAQYDTDICYSQETIANFIGAWPECR